LLKHCNGRVNALLTSKNGCMLKFVVFLGESVNESGDLALIVSSDGLLLLLDSLTDLIVELLLLFVNERLQVLEHTIHLLGEVLKVIFRLLFTIIQFLLIVFDVLFEFVDLLHTTSYHDLFSLESVHSHRVDPQNLSEILQGVLPSSWFFLLALLLLQIVRNAFFAHWTIKGIHDRLWKMCLAEITRYL
jgi:hypothetical protein